ncbi:MAG: 50S ribosomal protein L30 [Candidatus Aenigmatarchaeota archaeon]|nr:MAG: 50S ribosomal protein L30 [Candidatus Aenigmarchaeota archaeon]
MAEKNSGFFAVIRVRGPVNVNRETEHTMKMLRLDRTNHCVIVPSNPTMKGMLHRAEECITWGEVDQATLEKMIAKRGRVDGKKAPEVAKLMLSGKKPVDGTKVFRLTPPSKGYRPTRRFYPKGALGYRGDKINNLIRRMI